MILHGDFETFSRAPLKKCGGYRYAADPSTEILCFCWAIDDGDVETWVPSVSVDEARANEHLQPLDWYFGRRVPPTLAAAVRSGAKFTAHNASFERAIWQRVVVARHGGPSTRREQFVCTATRAAASGLPRALGPLGDALGTSAQKDKEGDRLLKKFAQPRKPTKADTSDRIKPLDDVLEFIKLVQYCQQDVRTEAEVDQIIPHLNADEQRLFAFDMQINERGFRIDIPLVRSTQKILAHLEAEVVAEVVELTKSDTYPDGLRPTQRDKMLWHFHQIGVKLENMQADHVRKYMRTNVRTLSAEGRRLLQLRIEAGKASTKKLASMLMYADLDHIARGTLMMYGAHTGRWSGKGVQPHNFIRGLLKWKEQVRVFEMLAKGDPEAFDIIYEWPIGIISQVMRGFIIPAEGKQFYVVDYASIEARVLSWLANDTEMLVAFANGIDVYKLMATVIFGCTLEEVTSEQRRISKNVVLGCGYGLGAVKFVSYSEKAGVEITEELAKFAVNVYRKERYKIVQLWGDVERCAIAAVREKRTASDPVKLRMLEFFVDTRWLCIRLPSGRLLRYYQPRVTPVEKWGKPSLQLSYKVDFRGRMFSESTYGGKLVENITQAVARDLLVRGMFAAEEAGYTVRGTVHDEIVTERPIGTGNVHELEKIVCTLPPWAKGMPVSAEGFESPRYRKG